MANEKFTQLPTVTTAQLSDIICAVQAGISSQETLEQIFNLMLANVVFNNAGNPNGVLAGEVYQFCWDTTNHILYICTTTGSSMTAVWSATNGFAVPLSVSLGGTGATTLTSNGILVGHGSSAITSSTLTDGQILIGSTGIAPVAANISAGAGISISSGPGTITISGTGSGFGWTEVTGTSQMMMADNGYVANNAGLVTLIIPATAAFGTTINVIGKGAGGWLIQAGVGQTIQVGSLATSSAGTVASTNRYDSIQLICTTANTVWTTLCAPQSAGLTIT